MNKPSDISRRDFVKTTAYVAPLVLTLSAVPSLAQAGSPSKGLKTKNATSEPATERPEDGPEKILEPSFVPRIIGYKDGGGGEGVAPDGGSADYAIYR
jgi:hypothetical protein